MKYLICIVISTLTFSLWGQNSYRQYLQKNSSDLRKSFPQLDLKNQKIIGFAAIHGSAKTEEAEHILLTELIKNHQLKYYFPETDYATALYFQKFIDTGDTILLKKLIYEYGSRVPQEGTVETYQKWLKIQPIFKQHNVQVLGIDKVISYKYSVIALHDEIKHISGTSYSDSLQSLIQNPNTNWMTYFDSRTKKILKSFVADYEQNQIVYQNQISDTSKFNFIIKNLKATWTKGGREQRIYDNYLHLLPQLELENQMAFVRFGVFHIMKSRINNYASFFTRLIENKVYTSSQMVSIQCFLTKSKVLWDAQFDTEGNYKGYSKRAGIGTSDHIFEHYKGIKNLKHTRISDLTFFNLDHDHSPYSIPSELDLVKSKKLLYRKRWMPDASKSTLDYLDYAILISKSKANTPIEEIHTP
ncbi:hypothetical protein KFE94_05365 [bacterium SCSIO 12643]|nr:hypothetical protein KFE94_05365 [bacterium SCSIO 12643]